MNASEIQSRVNEVLGAQVHDLSVLIRSKDEGILVEFVWDGLKRQAIFWPKEQTPIPVDDIEFTDEEGEPSSDEYFDRVQELFCSQITEYFEETPVEREGFVRVHFVHNGQILTARFFPLEWNNNSVDDIEIE